MGHSAPPQVDGSTYAGRMEELRVLLVEDEDDIARPLASGFAREGIRLERFPSAEEGLAAIPSLQPQLVILDISLPGMSGLAACRIVRERWDIPVIMLTARGATEDRVLGLELGADDYVPKPFSSHELVARVRALIRRSVNWRPERRSPVVAGALELDPERREVRVSGRPVHLTRREFDLVATLAARSPAVVRRDELMREVWDQHWHGPTQTLDVHVAQVRRKIEPDPANPRFLHTVRGVGYQVRDACDAT